MLCQMFVCPKKKKNESKKIKNSSLFVFSVHTSLRSVSLLNIKNLNNKKNEKKKIEKQKQQKNFTYC